MRSVNKVILIGNLTRDPNIRQTPSGQLVATFGIATNRQWITKDNQKQNSTEFHELVSWAKLAELAEKHLKKGKLVYVEGYLSTRSWETPEGTKKFKTEIVVEDMIMLNKRGDHSEASSPSPSRDTQEKATEEVAEEKTTEMPEVTETPKQEAPVTPTEPVVIEEEMVSPAEHAEEKSDDNIIDRDLGL